VDQKLDDVDELDEEGDVEEDATRQREGHLHPNGNAKLLNGETMFVPATQVGPFLDDFDCFRSFSPLNYWKRTVTDFSAVNHLFQESGIMTEDMLDEQQAVFERLGTSAEAAAIRAKMQSAQVVSGTTSCISTFIFFSHFASSFTKT
jgi:hypothetical protein